MANQTLGRLYDQVEAELREQGCDLPRESWELCRISELGLDSFAILMVAVALEDASGLALEPELIDADPPMNILLNRIAEQLGNP